MRTTCPAPQELARMLDGEATQNRADQLREHAGACAACRAELGVQERLRARVAAQFPADSGAVERLMARLDEPAHGRAAGKTGARVRVAMAVAAVAASAAGLAALVWTPGPSDAGRFAARGGDGASEWRRRVGSALWVLEPTPRRLEDGTSFRAGDPLVASYRHLGEGPAFLLAFGVDAGGYVHWLYPGFQDAATNPAAVRLEPTAAERMLPESVVLDGLPAGPIRLFLVVSPEPLDVAAVESTPASRLEPGTLSARWPRARLTTLELVVEPTSPSKRSP